MPLNKNGSYGRDQLSDILLTDLFCDEIVVYNLQQPILFFLLFGLYFFNGIHILEFASEISGLP